MNEARGWIFVTVRLLLLYIRINRGKRSLYNGVCVCVGGAGGGGFLCEYFSLEKPQDGLCVKIVGMEHEQPSV